VESKGKPSKKARNLMNEKASRDTIITSKIDHGDRSCATPIHRGGKCVVSDDIVTTLYREMNENRLNWLEKRIDCEHSRSSFAYFKLSFSYSFI
jgi:hypothetical protein